LTAALASVGTGCVDPPEHSEAPPPAPEVAEAPAVNTEAHDKALRVVLDSGAEAMARADPLAAARLDPSAGLAAPRYDHAHYQALAASLAEPASMAREIDETALGPAQVVVLRTIRFGLERLNQRVSLDAPEWRDPNVALAELEDFVHELEFRLATDTTADLAPAMQSLATALAPLSGRVGGTSDAIAGHIALRATRFADRVAGLEGAGEAERWAAATGAAVEEARGLAESYARLSAALEVAPTATWRSPSRAPHPSRALQRLPERLGGIHVRHRMLREERLDDNSGVMFGNAEQLLDRYAGLRQQHGAGEDAPGRTVDVERCQAAWQPIAAWASTSTEVAGVDVNCASVARIYSGRTVTDGELTLTLIDWGISEPTARESQKKHARAIGLLTSPHGRRAHRLLHGVSVAIAIGDPAAVRAAVDRARAAVCHGALVVWLHGEAGDEDKLLPWVRARCAVDSDDAAEVRRQEALGDPLGGTAGLIMARVVGGPAAMVPTMIYPWAPAGIQRLLATPKGVHPDAHKPPPPPPRPVAPPKIEPIRPGQPVQ
jgi:hypothetical protein